MPGPIPDTSSPFSPYGLREDADHVLRMPEWDLLPWLEHGFGTRQSVGWPPAHAAALKQIHSDVIRTADGQTGYFGEGDALVTAAPGTVISVRTADCVPLLMLDPRRRAVAAVHAGWRGTLLDIAGKTVERLQSVYGSEPADLTVAIGPAIGFCCFEVGPEVAAPFHALFPERNDLEGRTTVDLVEANIRQLTARGLARHQIRNAAACTACDPAKFHSYRRERGTLGRLFAVIGIRPEKAEGPTA